MTESAVDPSRPGVEDEVRGTAAADTAPEPAGKTRLSVSKTYKLYIKGAFPRTESGRTFPVADATGSVVANACQASRKDFREAVVAARAAQSGWAARSAYNRAQILYRIAEMLEGRSSQFEAELVLLGSSGREARREVEASIDRLVYYAGWCDKYQQIFSSVNPVSSSHFNFSMLEPTGVVALFAPENPSLLGLASVTAATIAGGNTVVALASESKPLAAITFAEVLHSSDVPGGVVNILTGYREELLEHFASHMDVNSLLYCGSDKAHIETAQKLAASNVKRVVIESLNDWYTVEAETPYAILAHQEVKTTWHPIGT